MMADQQTNTPNGAQRRTRLTRHLLVRKTHPTGSARLTTVDAFLSTGVIKPVAMTV